MEKGEKYVMKDRLVEITGLEPGLVYYKDCYLDGTVCHRVASAIQWECDEQAGEIVRMGGENDL